MPVDLKTYYVKRCVALPNDTIRIVNGDIFINGILKDQPINFQNRYFIKTKTTINERIFKKYGIWEYTKVSNGYFINTKNENAEAIARESFVNEVTIYRMNKSTSNGRIFPDSKKFPWNTDHFGPLMVPYKGLTIELSDENISKYGSIIKNFT